MDAIRQFLAAVLSEKIPVCTVVGFALMCGDPIIHVPLAQGTLPYKLSVAKMSNVMTA